LLPLLVTFAGAVYMLYRISPSIAGTALVAVPLFFLVTKLIGRHIRPLSSEWVRSHADMFATLEENIGMLPAIKSFTREAHESDRFRRSNTRLLRIAKRQLLLESLLTPSVHLMAGLGLLLLYLGTRQVQHGELAAADLVSILLYGMLMTRPVSGLAGVYGSVRENIAYSRPDADQPSIEAAARAAQAHTFICALPNGYETVIGDQGVRLSGGQRQRIALARAMLKDPPILVLDEATSMFDPDGEASFIEDCRAALEQRTVILITHRPASLALADRVLRLEAGRVE